MRYYRTYKKEQGAALIVALIFLIVITLLGISAMDDTVLETQLAKNNREKIYALQVAERGLMNSIPILMDTSGNQDILIGSIIQTGSFGFDDNSSDAFDEVQINRNDISVGTTKVIAQSQNTEISFKGFFPQKRTTASQSYSNKEGGTGLVYFETRSEGESAPNQREAQLRNGMRRIGPDFQ